MTQPLCGAAILHTTSALSDLGSGFGFGLEAWALDFGLGASSSISSYLHSLSQGMCHALKRVCAVVKWVCLVVGGTAKTAPFLLKRVHSSEL